MTRELISNIRFLVGFSKQRKGYIDFIPLIIERLTKVKETTINELLDSFSDEIDTLILLPIIYHLIATGRIFTNIDTIISEFSEISIYGGIDYFSYLKGVTDYENK